MLLFDQKISWRIVRLLKDDYPGCIHLSKQGLMGASDRRIWSEARRKGFVVVTFDQDYIDLAGNLGNGRSDSSRK